MNPPELRYTAEHEWVRIVTDNQALVGITDYAQQELGDVVYLSLPAKGAHVKQAEKLGEIESVKAVSDVFCPISGVVEEVNEKVQNSPELVNQDPYGEGWLVKISLADTRELDNLMTAEQYGDFLKKEQYIS